MKTNIIILFISTLLVACGSTEDTPSQVSLKYWQAMQQGNVNAAKKYITAGSGNLIDTHAEFIQQLPSNSITVKNETATADIIFNTENNIDKQISIQTSLVQEEGEWKVDLNKTQLPAKKAETYDFDALTEKLNESMKDNAKTIEQMADEGMKLFNDAFREGSGEMSKTMLEAMKDIKEKMDKSINKMKERRQQKEAPPAEKTTDESGEGLI